MVAFEQVGVTALVGASVVGREEARAATLCSGSVVHGAEEAEAELVPPVLYGSLFPVSAAY